MSTLCLSLLARLGAFSRADVVLSDLVSEDTLLSYDVLFCTFAVSRVAGSTILKDSQESSDNSPFIILDLKELYTFGLALLSFLIYYP